MLKEFFQKCCYVVDRAFFLWDDQSAKRKASILMGAIVLTGSFFGLGFVLFPAIILWALRMLFLEGFIAEWSGEFIDDKNEAWETEQK